MMIRSIITRKTTGCIGNRTYYAILQYRRKKIAKADQPLEVEQIKILCEKYQVPFVINDDLSLAEQFGLGVHLGQSDGKSPMQFNVCYQGA